VITDVLVLNGPNLGRLGIREPDVYGTATLEDLAETCRATGRQLDLHVEVRQTDDEAELIRWVHEARRRPHPGGAEPGCVHALLLRAAGRARDAHRAAGRGAPVQPGRARVVPAHLRGGRGGRRTVAGFGLLSYQLALQAIADLAARQRPGTVVRRRRTRAPWLQTPWTRSPWPRRRCRRRSDCADRVHGSRQDHRRAAAVRPARAALPGRGRGHRGAGGLPRAAESSPSAASRPSASWSTRPPPACWPARALCWRSAAARWKMPGRAACWSPPTWFTCTFATPARWPGSVATPAAPCCPGPTWKRSTGADWRPTRAVATHTVPTDGRAPADVCGEIVSRLGSAVPRRTG